MPKRKCSAVIGTPSLKTQPLAQMERERIPVGAELPRLRRAGDDLQLLVDASKPLKIEQVEPLAVVAELGIERRIWEEIAPVDAQNLGITDVLGRDDRATPATTIPETRRT